MPFLIYAIDYPNMDKTRETFRQAHRDHHHKAGDKVLAAGALLSDDGKTIIGGITLLDVYRNNLKNREFDQEAPRNLCSERATIAHRQGASENKNSEVKPTLSKTDSSGCFGINTREEAEKFMKDDPYSRMGIRKEVHVIGWRKRWWDGQFLGE